MPAHLYNCVICFDELIGQTIKLCLTESIKNVVGGTALCILTADNKAKFVCIPFDHAWQTSGHIQLYGLVCGSYGFLSVYLTNHSGLAPLQDLYFQSQTLVPQAQVPQVVAPLSSVTDFAVINDVGISWCQNLMSQQFCQKPAR